MGGIVSSAKMAMKSQMDHTPPNSLSKASSTVQYETLARMMMPNYFDSTPLNPELESLAITAWESVLSNSAPRYRRNCSCPDFATQYPTALEYFACVFFNRLFDTHPNIAPTMSRVTNRVKFVKDLVNFCAYDHSDEKTFRQSLELFAHIHHVRGVKALECKFLSIFICR